MLILTHHFHFILSSVGPLVVLLSAQVGKFALIILARDISRNACLKWVMVVPVLMMHPATVEFACQAVLEVRSTAEFVHQARTVEVAMDAMTILARDISRNAAKEGRVGAYGFTTHVILNNDVW